jgi:hypothetical protein
LHSEQIAQATGLTVRRIRYVLEHRVLPGTEKASRGHRVTRNFTPFESFGIAAAAEMLEGGIRRPLVTKLMTALTKCSGSMRSADVPLFKASESRGPSHLQIGDGVNVRVAAGTSTAPWRQISTGATVADYQPRVLISIDVGRIRDEIRRAAGA